MACPRDVVLVVPVLPQHLVRALRHMVEQGRQRVATLGVVARVGWHRCHGVHGAPGEAVIRYRVSPCVQQFSPLSRHT